MGPFTKIYFFYFLLYKRYLVLINILKIGVVDEDEDFFFDINFKMEGVILSFWHFNFSNKNMHVRRTMPYKFFLYSNNIIFKCNCFYEQFSKKKKLQAYLYCILCNVIKNTFKLFICVNRVSSFSSHLAPPNFYITVLNSIRCTKGARIWGKNLRVSIELRKVVDGRAWCYKFVKTKYQ